MNWFERYSIVGVYFWTYFLFSMLYDKWDSKYLELYQGIILKNVGGISAVLVVLSIPTGFIISRISHILSSILFFDCISIYQEYNGEKKCCPCDYFEFAKEIKAINFHLDDIVNSSDKVQWAMFRKDFITRRWELLITCSDLCVATIVICIFLNCLHIEPISRNILGIVFFVNSISLLIYRKQIMGIHKETRKYLKK